MTPENITAAAQQLARLPRNTKRRYTGWVHRRHCKRGQLVIFSDGVVGELIWASRGRVLVHCQDDEEGDKIDPNDFAACQRDYYKRLRHFAARERDVQLYKLPSAVVLGALKAGCVERPSERKGAACRANGAMPCRPGRRRGRPRKLESITRPPAGHPQTRPGCPDRPGQTPSCA